MFLAMQLANGIGITTYLAGAAVLLVLAQMALTWRLASAATRIERYEERLERFGDVLSMLAETSESGFKAVATELERIAARTPAKKEPRTSTARVARSARKGRSVQEIAAEEDVSEGEVRLRLSLTDRALLERIDAPRAEA